MPLRKNIVIILIAFLITKINAGPFGYYPTYDEIDTLLDGLQERYPNIVKRIMLTPKTIENRDIFCVKVSNSPNADNKKPDVLITGVQHSAEPIGAAVIRNNLYHLCDNYDSDPDVKWLVDNRQIYFIPVLNPDGYKYIENGGSNSWRKNRRQNSGGSYGVDLNRNFPYKWGYDDINSSPNPTAMNYRGESPVSEPETKALVDFIHEHKFRTWQNHHSPRDVLVIPFGYNYQVSLPKQDSTAYYTMCEEQQACYGRFSKWGPSYIAYDGFALNGGSEDWGWSDSATYRIYCIITELGKDYWETDAKAKEVCEKMLGAELYMIKCAGFYPVIKEVSIVDTGAGCNNDGELNPGETVRLFVEIKNRAVVDTTLNVKGNLSSSSQYISVSDAEGSYGSVKMLEEVKNDSDPFVFKCAGNASQGTNIPFDVKVTWELNSVNYEKTLLCTLQVGPYTEIVSNNQISGKDIGLSIIPNITKKSVSFKLSLPKGILLKNSNGIIINIYEPSGRLIKTIDHILLRPSDVITWDGSANSGIQVKNGVYFIEAIVNGSRVSKDFVFVQ